MSNLKKSVLARITREAAKPLPRWIFVAKNTAWWTLLAAVILAAGLGAGAMVELLDTADWEILPQFPGGMLHFFWATVGPSWLLLLAAGVGAAAWIFRRTPHGYRIAGTLILILSFAGAAILGAGLVATHIAAEAVELHTQHIRPIFEHLTATDSAKVLEGVLTKSAPPTFAVRNFGGVEWQVDGRALPPPPPRGWPHIGERVRFLGTGDAATHIFTATQLRPLHGPRHFPFGRPREFGERK